MPGMVMLVKYPTQWRLQFMSAFSSLWIVTVNHMAQPNILALNLLQSKCQGKVCLTMESNDEDLLLANSIEHVRQVLVNAPMAHHIIG